MANYLVVGSGLAGLSFALRMAETSQVTVICKDVAKESNSSHAQGGIAAVLNPSDSYNKHILDTLKAGQGLCDVQAVEFMVKSAPEEISWLIEQGVEFDRLDSELDLSREGGHSSRRVVHAGDITGEAVQSVLVGNARENPNVILLEHVTCLDLIMKNDICCGITALDTNNSETLNVISDFTVLATGGAGQLYSKTSNPVAATGDGVAIAWRAGAVIRDMEFIQFHPTVLDMGESPYFLISETVRGEGGILVNALGEAFMTRYHPLQDLAPRDVVSRAIVEEQTHGPVYIDIRHRGREYLTSRFPGIYQECLRRGIRMDEDLIPVSPAAHYMCGGVKTNLNGETSVRGLYAIGECACTGVHGANRLASNSTLECMVFAHSAVKRLSGRTGNVKLSVETDVKPHDIDIEDEKRHLQLSMWTHAGIFRSLPGLRQGLRELNKIHENSDLQSGNNRELIELRNLVDTGSLVLRAAATRLETRGTHALEDYSRDDAHWLRHIEFTKNEKTVTT